MQNAVTRWQWPSVSASFKSSALVVRLFELVQRFLKARSAIFDLLFQIALVFSIFVDKPPVLQGAADAEEELVLFKGFQDVIVSAAADGFERRGDVVNCSHHNHGHVGIEFAHPFEKLDAVHLRHDHVAEDQVRCGALDVILCRAAVVRHGATVALGFEHC